MSLHTLLTQYDKDGNPYQVYEAASLTYGAPSWLRWYQCQLCGLDFRADRVQLINGLPYCKDCAEEKLDK